jgi:hypothetical protein
MQTDTLNLCLKGLLLVGRCQAPQRTNRGRRTLLQFQPLKLLIILVFGMTLSFNPSMTRRRIIWATLFQLGQCQCQRRKGKRQCNGWEFHYQGYKADTNFRDDASKDSSLFPEEHKGKLDADLTGETWHEQREAGTRRLSLLLSTNSAYHAYW